MAVVSRVATIVQSSGLGSRTWVATAATQDTAAGSSVVVTLTQSTTGSAPSQAQTWTLRYVDDAGNVIKTVALDVAAASQTDTFYFTDTGNVGGSARCGTIEIRMQVTRTSIPTYDVETDGSPNTAQATYTTSQLDRGYIRGTTTLTEAVSNVALGGAKNSPASYDDSLYFRATCGAASYVARALAVASSDGGLSGNTNSTTSATRDVTFANVCDDRFPTAATAVSWTATVPNATLTSLPDWAHSSTTDDSITVDPRLTRSYHFQVNNNTFALASADTTRRMLATQSGFLWSIIKNARAEGVNGLTVSQTLTPTNPGTAASGSGATSTQGGQAGVSARLDWTASKPDGTWTMVADVTAPSDADLDALLVNTGETYQMVARNPYIEVAAAGGNAGTDGAGRHYKRGDAFTFGGAAMSKLTGALVEADAGDANRKAIVGRFNPTLNAGLGGGEYLDASFEWQPWNNALTAYLHQLTEFVPGSRLYLGQAPAVATALWDGDYPIFVIPILYIDGWPYGLPVEAAVIGTAYAHNAQRELSVGSQAPA